MRLWMIILAAAVLLAGLAACSGSKSKSPSLGVDLANFDTAVRPQDDFFRYVNGSWLDRKEIPSDQARYGAFDELREKAEQDLRLIVEELVETDAEVGTEARQIGDLYRSFMAEEKLRELGPAPLRQDLERIAALGTAEDLLVLFGEAIHSGWSTPLGLFISQDQGRSDRYIVYFSQAGLGLPDRDFYLRNDERSTQILNAYRAAMERLLGLAGLAEVRQTAERVLELETRIAEKHWTRVQNRDRQATYNPTTIRDLSKQWPGFLWDRFLTGADLAGIEEVVVRQPDYLGGLSALLEEVPLATWKDYLAWHLVRNAAPYLSSDFVEAHFDFYGRVLQGLQEMKPRWKRGLELVNGILGDALGKIYVQRHFPPEAKERMEKLVANLKTAFGLAIDDLDWMGEETKTEARLKLSHFNAKIGYPLNWKDYSGLVVDPADLAGNLRRSNKLEYRRQLDRLGGPVDRDEWFMTPQTVNAYYSSSLNEVVFPAAILQPPFFNLAADEAVNYGAIGGVIGHEITHGFDDQGRRSDGEGNLRDWWSPEDEQRFRARAQLLIDQFNAYEPLPGMNINGELALGENIADLGGLNVAYRAYRLSLAGTEAPIIEGFSGSQRFFLGWAQVWRIKFRDEALRTQLMVGPHSPGQYRVLGPLSNMVQFYDAFEVREGDGMYRQPEQRARIW